MRAKIEVNPTTAALTVTSDNSGPYKIPQFIDGIPLQIKHVNVTIGRPGFTFNPTSCEHMTIEGSLSSTEGASKALSVPFQATNCASLKFTPKFSVTTSGKTSKANGASLTAKLSEPSEPQGTPGEHREGQSRTAQATPVTVDDVAEGVHKRAVRSQPRGLPVGVDDRYTRSCTPRCCRSRLTGPAIFVSHGGEAFPSLTMVLQGYGVTVDLVGTTFISKAGVTSTTFKTVPDVPFSTFELTLPEGPYSALTANGNLCALTKTVTVKKKVTVKSKGHKKTVTRSVKKTQPASLSMPSEFVAQNGAAIHETTPVSVTGCPKAVKVKAKGKKGKKANKAGGARKGRR